MIKKYSPEILKEFALADERIDYIRSSSIGTPRQFRHDLAAANTDLELTLSGNFIYVTESNDFDDHAYIKFSKRDGSSFRISKGLGFITPFDRIFLTNTAQAAGYLDIIYGSLAPDFLSIIDNRSDLLTAELLDDIADYTRVLRFIPVGSAEILASAITLNAAASNIYTVPAGQVFYMTEANIAFGSSSGSAQYAYIYDGTTKILVCSSFYNPGLGMIWPNTVAQQFMPPVMFTAGTVISLRNETINGVAANDYSQATIKGYLV